jgi:amino acid permease
MILLTETDRVFLFLLTAACLGACFIWAFWELEQIRERHRLRAAQARASAKRNLR